MRVFLVISVKYGNNTVTAVAYYVVMEWSIFGIFYCGGILDISKIHIIRVD